MRTDAIDSYLRSGQLRVRQPDGERIKSMADFAKTNARVAKEVALDEDSATLVFREIYESIRQLGDAKWWLLGYEPKNHEVSMEILMEMDIWEKLMLNHLPRFKRIRNDANYRGFRVTSAQAREIILFWDKCADDIIKEIFKKRQEHSGKRQEQP